jgi:outer membrane murein-binding lipoprotein Lpp
MMKVFAAAAMVALVAGCASAPESKPTHYWESAHATENRYRVDNLACKAAAEAEPGEAAFDTTSESFQSYRDCMVERGYVLRHY